MCSGPGPAGFPDGPTGTAAPPRLVSSAGTGWRACSSSRPRSSVSRCWLWPVSSCTLTSCCCTASRSVFTSPRSCTRYACCATRRSCTAASSARTESTFATCWLSARARSTRNASTWSSTRRTSPFSAHPAVSPRTRTNGRADLNRVSRSRLFQALAAGEDFELVAAILRPRVLVVSGGERPLLAVGHGLDAARIDAVTDDVLLGRRRAPVTERQVVFVGPALVAMAADADAQRRVGLKDRHLLVQDCGVPTPDERLVIIEVDHRRDEGPHCLRRLSDRGERIRSALPRLPFRRFAVTGFLLGPLACFLRCPLGGVDRILIDGHRRGRCLRLLPAARGERYGDQTAQQEQG